MKKLPLDEDQNTVWMRMLYNEAKGVFLNLVIMMKRTDHLNLLNMISLSINCYWTQPRTIKIRNRRSDVDGAYIFLCCLRDML